MAVATEASPVVAAFAWRALTLYIAAEASRSLPRRPLTSCTTPCFCLSSAFCVLMRSIGRRSIFISAVTIEAVSMPLPIPLNEIAGDAVVLVLIASPS